MAKSAMQDFLEYYDKNIAPRIAQIANSPGPAVYQIWSHGHCSNPECRKIEPVIRDSRIYFDRGVAEKELEKFPGDYLVEYPTKQ